MPRHSSNSNSSSSSRPRAGTHSIRAHFLPLISLIIRFCSFCILVYRATSNVTSTSSHSPSSSQVTQQRPQNLGPSPNPPQSLGQQPQPQPQPQGPTQQRLSYPWSARRLMLPPPVI